MRADPSNLATWRALYGALHDDAVGHLRLSVAVYLRFPDGEHFHRERVLPGSLDAVSAALETSMSWAVWRRVGD